MGQEISHPIQRQNCTKLPLNNKINNNNSNSNTKLDCKLNLQKQKLHKTPSTHSSLASGSSDSSSGYQTTSTTSAKIKPILVYDQISPESSVSSITNQTGIYYPSYYCSSSGRSSVSASIASSVPSSKQSHKSVNKQKDYLDHQLYIKSYLDIVEEDEKAKEHFKPARPGIRNYTPKILAEKKSRSQQSKEEAWI